MQEHIQIPPGSDIYKFVDNYIQQKFGDNVDDFFVHSSQRVAQKTSKKTFQVVLVEDKKGKLNQLWFEIL